MTLRRLTAIVFTLLIAFAPSGTRYIFRNGMIGGHVVEPGTVSVFGMQFVALAFIGLAFFGHGRKEVAELLRKPPATFAAFLAIFAFISAFRADDMAAGLVSAGFVVLGVAVFLAVLLFRPDPHEALTAFVGGAVFQFAIGGYQFLTQRVFASKWLGMAMHSSEELGAFVVETTTGRWLRAYGSLSHPNVFGLYVGIGLLMCVGLAAFRGHGRHLRFYALMPLITAALLFSFSRSAIVAIAAGFLWMVVSAYGSEAAPAFRRVLLPSFIIIAVTFGALGSLYFEPLRTRVSSVGRLEERSFSERGVFLADGLALFLRHPLTGVGAGQMPLAVKREVDPDRPWWQYQQAHNVPLLVAAETGIGGLLAWLGFVASTLFIIVKRLSRRTGAATGVTVYAASFIALIVASFFDHFLWSSWFGQLLFWSVAGLLHAAYSGIHRKNT